MNEWYKHDHPGYSNCPRCVERIRELEQALDEAPSRDRLRELEAELAKEKNLSDAEYENYIDVCKENDVLKARAEKAEARVAELEKRVASVATREEVFHRFWCSGMEKGIHRYNCPDREAREREAE